MKGRNQQDTNKFYRKYLKYKRNYLSLKQIAG